LRVRRVKPKEFGLLLRALHGRSVKRKPTAWLS